MFANNLQLSDVWGPRLSPVYRRHWGLAPAQTASLCPWHWNLLWNLLPSLILMDLTHQGLSFWALSLLHTNCWPLAGLSLRQSLLILFGLMDSLSGSWSCLWLVYTSDWVMPPPLPTTQHQAAGAGSSTLCLLLAQDSFQLIDFKFFFKFYSRRSFWWLIFEIFLLLELIKQFDCN